MPKAPSGMVRVVATIALVLVLVVGVDAGLNWGKVFPGVRVGGVDLGGLTQEQAQEQLATAYQGRLYQGVITVYAGEEQKEAVESGKSNDLGPEEQLSVEQVQANTQKWTVTPADLGASVDYAQRAQDALQVGRSNGLIFGRLGALIGGTDLDLGLTFDQEKVESFAQKIDKTIGNPRVDYNIAVEDGVAYVTEGHDGTMVDRAELSGNVEQIVLTSANGSGEFIANAPHAALRIDQKQAERVCSTVNAAIADGAVISGAASSWQATASDVGEWIVTDVVQDGSSWKLVPGVSEERCRAAIVQQLKEGTEKQSLTVGFTLQNAKPMVTVSGEGTMPQTQQAAQDLTTALFGSDQGNAQDGAKAADGQAVSIQVEWGPIPSPLTFQQALDAGVIERISTYTTEYNTGEGTEARVNNIHVAADELNNSICPAGGTWSFNTVAGESTEEKGFQAAGSIYDGEYVDSIGGGVCQVATTVFNAVYESGFPVNKRRNHTLYIASYPEGRDAAVSFPDLDLEWANDSASDVLMRTSYTDSTVTVSLYGVNPGYQVSSELGDWEPGKEYKRYVKRDPDYPDGYTEIQTSGTNGSVVSITRTVKSADGVVIREDVFTSEYDPKDEVTLVGTGGGSEESGMQLVQEHSEESSDEGSE